jgi:hypothetical protein
MSPSCRAARSESAPYPRFAQASRRRNAMSRCNHICGTMCCRRFMQHRDCTFHGLHFSRSCNFLPRWHAACFHRPAIPAGLSRRLHSGSTDLASLRDLRQAWHLCVRLGICLSITKPNHRRAAGFAFGARSTSPGHAPPAIAHKYRLATVACGE